MDYTQHFDSPLGGITLACDGEALIGLWFDGQKHFGAALKPEHAEKRMPVLEEAERWLRIYFSGEAPDFTPALSLRGTAFQKQVWEALLTVPYGGTATYAEIASRAAKRAGTGACARAAGSAIARNPVSLIVPCHRVVGADGSLTGYAGGVRRKQALLSLERAPKILLPSGAVCGTLLENQPREVHLPCACAGPAKT